MLAHGATRGRLADAAEFHQHVVGRLWHRPDLLERLGEVVGDRTAHAAVGQRQRRAVVVGDQRRIHVERRHVVDEHHDSPTAGVAHHVIDDRRLAGPEISTQQCEWHTVAVPEHQPILDVTGGITSR